MNVNEEAVKNFLIEAKKHTYADDGEKVISSRLKSKDLEYCDKGFFYLDSYFGAESFSGQEVVWYKNNPIWSMTYY